MLETKIDDTLFKSLAKMSCKLPNCIKMISICIITSNEMPNFRVDTGMARRLKAYTHESKFTDKEEVVDESKHIYLAVQDFMDQEKIMKCLTHGLIYSLKKASCIY